MPVRLFPINDNNATAVVGAGAGSAPLRSYSTPSGTPLDVPGFDLVSGDCAALLSQGYFAVGTSGPTSSRPPVGVARVGQIHIDTGLNAVLVWTGASWRNVFTGTAM